MLQPYLPCILLLLLSLQCGCQWTQIINGSLSMPGHVYQVQCTANSVLRGVIAWNGFGNDLDLFIYEEGRQLMSQRQASAVFQSWSRDERQRFQFNVNRTGKYYLRVLAYQVTLGQDYNISISNTNWATPLLYSAYFHRRSKYMTAVLINAPPQNGTLPIKYTTEGTSAITIIIVSSTNPNTYYYTTLDSVICLPSDFSDRTWILLFNHSLSNLRSIASYNYTLSYNLNSTECSTNNSCSAGLVWDDHSQSCVSGEQDTYSNQIQDKTETSFSSIVKIVMITLGCVVGFFFILGIIVCFAKSRKKQDRRNVVHPLQIEEQYSHQNLEQQQKDVCSICLESGCNSYLPCQHWFHYKCISEWYGRNKLCPMCRKSFKGLKVIKKQDSQRIRD